MSTLACADLCILESLFEQLSQIQDWNHHTAGSTCYLRSMHDVWPCTRDRLIGVARPTELNFGEVVVQPWVAQFFEAWFFFWIHLRCWKRTSLWTEFSMPSVRELVLSFVHGEVFNWRRNMPFSIMQSVCQWMMLLPSLWNHFVFVSKIVGTPDRFSESTPMLLPRNPKTSSVLTSLIVPFGHKPGDLATRNLDQLPEPLGRMDLHVASSMPDGRRGFRVAQSAFRTLRRRCTLRRKIVAEEHVVLVFWCGVHTIFLW